MMLSSPKARAMLYRNMRVARGLSRDLGSLSPHSKLALDMGRVHEVMELAGTVRTVVPNSCDIKDVPSLLRLHKGVLAEQTSSHEASGFPRQTLGSWRFGRLALACPYGADCHGSTSRLRSCDPDRRAVSVDLFGISSV